MKLSKLISSALLIILSTTLLSANSLANTKTNWREINNSSGKGYLTNTQVPKDKLASFILINKTPSDINLTNTFSIIVGQDNINNSRVNLNREVSLTLYMMDNRDRYISKITVPLEKIGFNERDHLYSFAVHPLFSINIEYYLITAKGKNVMLSLEDVKHSLKLGFINTSNIQRVLK